MKTVIIGAGFTGLACGIKTGSTIYEATDHAGGICTDYVKDGFRFSNGGPHFLFGKDKGLEYIKGLVEVKEYERKAGVYYNHIFPYPIQRFAQQVNACNPVYMKSAMGVFGTELCNMFFNPFNEKYTAGLYDEVLPQDEYKSPKTGTGWVSTFCDPVNGLSDLVDKMASKCNIEYNKKVEYINPDEKIIGFGGGYHEHYDRLISTIPLNKCMEMCGQKVNLPYTSVLVINIGGLVDVNTPEEHWLYIPFCKSGFHRVSFYTNVDKSKSKELHHVGLSVEIAFKDKKLSDIDIDKITQEVTDELRAWRWISRVFTTQADWVECAYTWQYNKEDVPNALAWLKERDIISTGRYGKWKFQGLTQSIEDGFNV